MINVFVDGGSGTTGLEIAGRIANDGDICLITVPDELRKDPSARLGAYRMADVIFLCLPDAASKKASEMAKGLDRVIIDTSTAHRCSDGWTYGMPEINGNREKIRDSSRIANPGCHASGFIALVNPLVSAGIMDSDLHLSCMSVTGYSGGGKNMIAAYEDPDREEGFSSPRQYGLSQSHKHLPEMAKMTGMSTAPAFMPVVADFYRGMEVTVPVFADDIKGSAADIRKIYSEFYGNDGIIHYNEGCDENGFLAADRFAGRDDMEISVFGNEDRIILCARYDNLGKGASGSAIQNMNIVTGRPEDTGLNIKDIDLPF